MKNLKLFCLLAAVTFSLSSCFTMSYMVGSGPQSGVQVIEKNHYVINGLAPVKVSNPSIMAGDSKNYQVTITHTFIDGLISALTFGLYSPTTTIINK